MWLGNPIIATPVEVEAGEPVQRIVNGINARPYNAHVPFTAASGIAFTDWRARDHRGKLYLTDAEMALGRKLREEGPYWVVEPSPSRLSNPNKRWLLSRFQEVVSDNGRTWVQPFHRDSATLMGAFQVVTPSFRSACGLLASAHGYLGTEGGFSHAAAALGVPAVIIFGGCMSVETFGYPEHVNLVDDGPETPCGRWLPCPHCETAMARITTADVLAALEAAERRV